MYYVKGISFTENQIKSAFSNSKTLMNVSKLLGVSYKGQCYSQLKSIAHELHIDLSAYSFIGRGRGIRKTPSYSDEEVFCLNTKATLSTVKYRLQFKHKKECSECHITNLYNNKPIMLQMHHINGNSFDNRLENLTWLCPNCHSQTPNYAGRRLAYGTEFTKKYCLNCDKQISFSSTRCQYCSSINIHDIRLSNTIKYLTVEDRTNIANKIIQYIKEGYKHSGIDRRIGDEFHITGRTIRTIQKEFNIRMSDKFRPYLTNTT